MRIIISLILLASFVSCIQEQTTQGAVQSAVSPDSLKSISKYILISSGQFAMGKTIKYSNSKFDLVVNPGNDTVYLCTEDPLFETLEGYKVGMIYSQITPKDLQSLQMENGWGYYVTTASGWQLGFCEGSSCTDSPPKSNSRVNWIFKRNQSY